ncbi:hypothetical protein P2R12_22325 [Cytobacillus oceanisediminis]|uniref:hypothetical protein n=1 Tax=Cytobacillus oceanisediminis TaxID=665099 RepID=UPI0023DC77D7|nr:hypothetical protein [Cytobacillus oceanisediminis]MDF2039679.1 hypothetical protein [Cytobacillus oceanisediminis]
MISVGNRNQYLRLLKPVKRQLLFQLIVKEFQVFLLSAAVLAFFLMMAARFFVIPFLQNYLLLILFLSALYAAFRTWKKRPDMIQAASLYNTFVAEDRVITAHSFLNDDGILARLQLADAVKHMKKVHHQVLSRKKPFILPKPILMFLSFLGLAVLLYMIPGEKMELALKQEKEIKIVEEAKEKLEKNAEKEKNPEVKKALEEAKEKIAEKKSAEEALKELEKLTKSLELKAMKENEKSIALENMKNNLDKSGLEQLSRMLKEKDLASFREELSKLDKQRTELDEDQRNALKELTGSEAQLSEEELSSLLDQLEKALQSEELFKQLAAAQDALQRSGVSLQQQMAANGMTPGQLTFAPPGQPGSSENAYNTPQQGQQNNSNQQNNQNQAGNSSNSGNGSGSGSGSGSGNGSGSGTGAGSGNGSGSGLGGGAGLGQGSRDLLTIPSGMEGKTNIENDNGSLGQGSPGQQLEGEGPVLKGNIRPYSEVFGNYEKSYRQSTDRYKLPADLEEIVKNYFTSIDPDKE